MPTSVIPSLQGEVVLRHKDAMFYVIMTTNVCVIYVYKVNEDLINIK